MAEEEEEVPPPPPQDVFVVEISRDVTSEAEVKVDYQAALSKLLLMELQSPDSETVASAARKLDNFFQTDEHSAHTDCFCALGGHGLLLMLLQRWQDDQHIQECLFSSLSLLSIWARSNQPDVLSTILIMRGIDLIADSMKRFPDSGKLYVDCLVTITCLCRKEDFDRHATTRASIASAVPMVCQAIKSFPENRNVLFSGCRALIAFCEMKLDEIKALKGIAISVVGASLQNFPDDGEINTIAFSFLRNLGTMCGYTSDEAPKQSQTEEVIEEEIIEEPVSKPTKKWGAKNW